MSQRNHPQRMNRGVFLYKYVVTVESVQQDDCLFPRNLVSILKLDDQTYFPSDNSKISPPAHRQLWEKGDSISINWPSDENNRLTKGITNILTVVVHGLYLDHASAKKASDQLEEQYKQLSLERERRLLELENDLDNGNDNGSKDSSDESVGGTISPPRKRSRHGGRCNDQSVHSEIAESRQRRPQLLAQPDSHDHPMQQLTEKILEKLDKLIERSDSQEIKMQSMTKGISDLKETIAGFAKKQGLCMTKVSDFNRIITGKVVPTTRNDSVEHKLFDPAKEPIYYMGIDRTNEINDLFECRGGKDSDFSRGLGKFWYADDLYFFMFRTSDAGGKANDRRPLIQRDPEGVARIQKILKRYWVIAIWPTDSDNVRLSAEIQSMKPDESASKIAELSSLKRIQFDKWINSAYDWMNDWGTEARKRKICYYWTNSLFGRSIKEASSDQKPKTYDEAAENDWRRTLFNLKKSHRTLESFIPAEDGSGMAQDKMDEGT